MTIDAGTPMAQEILRLHKLGWSAAKIAKRLELDVGEVTRVIVRSWCEADQPLRGSYLQNDFR